MTLDGEKRHRKTRKGLPHHQDELPGIASGEPEDTTPLPRGSEPAPQPADAELPPTQEPENDTPTLMESPSVRRHKDKSVIRNSLIRSETEESDGSMVGRVVDDLLKKKQDEPETRQEAILEEEIKKDESSLDEEVEEVPEDDERNPGTSAEDTERETAGSGRAGMAKRYEAIHNRLFVVDIVVTIGAILAFLLLGGSTNLRDWIHGFTQNPWIVPVIYAVVITLVYYFVLLIPLNAVDFNYEHKFRLSTQSFASWLEDNFKSLVLNMVLVIIFLEVTYFLLRQAPRYWWMWAAGIWTIFGVIMTNLMPVLILPLFYRLNTLANQSLRERLKGLAGRVHMKVLDVYEIKLSRKTKKANAMLAGLGNTKRIILGDTLLADYSEEEIETVIAHELGHHYHNHVPKLVAVGTAVTFAGFYAAHRLLSASLDWLSYLGIIHISDIAAFPLLIVAVFLVGLILMPVTNWFSRKLEMQADRFALRLTDRPAEFISAMGKLADQNLADSEPSAIVEFLLHDHPSISKRVAAAEEYSTRKRA